MSEIFHTSFTHTAPVYNNKLPESLISGDHLKQKRFERGLSARQAIVHFSIESSSAYRAWETNRKLQISVQYYPEIVAFLDYCPVETFTTKGQQLQLYRKYAGLTQRQLARQINSNDTAVMRWEQDKCDIPESAKKELEKIFGMTFD